LKDKIAASKKIGEKKKTQAKPKTGNPKGQNSGSFFATHKIGQKKPKAAGAIKARKRCPEGKILEKGKKKSVTAKGPS